MQFVRNGPDVPERLLQAHEDGRVVFFCGAGVSFPARLPGFKGLVKRLFHDLGITPTAVQQAAIKAQQFDTAIGLIEADIAGGREKVRRAMAEILTPDLTVPGATTTHEALLALGKNREGRTRLITTNFDRLFEEVRRKSGLRADLYCAPLLPVPKSRWDGLVYLHGLIQEAPTPSDLDCLVVSSGDFGLAYLNERWASRFVSELFRTYTVCFVGYSIADPVLRYMMDALAADRLRGESPPEMFAFGSFARGKEDDRSNEWRAKNVTPILYREQNRHSLLHKTLRAWAETYQAGERGKEHIVATNAVLRPLATTKQDDFVGRMLWALADPRGLPSKRFADHDPVPSLEWLEPICEERYGWADLNRFGVAPHAQRDNDLKFSLSRRPSPYDYAAPMTLVSRAQRSTRLDIVMRHLAEWLTRHLDDPALVLWVIKNGGRLHEEFEWLIERRLDELAKLERDGKVDDLARIRSSAVSAIPGPLMRTLWRVILTGRVKSTLNEVDLFRLLDRFRRDGFTATLRLELRDALAPRVSLREPFHWPDADEKPRPPRRLKDLVEWEVVLASKDVHSTLGDAMVSPAWKAAQTDLLTDFAGLLRDALDLMRELGGADDKSDHSYRDQPSIAEHAQNQRFHDWTALIELTRDAWLATASVEPERARYVAQSWLEIPYPLFKRLAFFAAAQSAIVSPVLVVQWLLVDGGWWLWSVETEREALVLLVSRARHLDDEQRATIESAILAGPPRGMYKDDIEAEHWVEIADREVRLRLAKLKAAGSVLSAPSTSRLEAIEAKYPHRKLAMDESDTFPLWMGNGDDFVRFEATPRGRRALMVWLKEHPSRDHWDEDDWRQRCRDNFATTACALCGLAAEGVWLVERWREALQAWSEESLVRRSWGRMGPLLINAPGTFFASLDHGIAWWIKSVAKLFDRHEQLFLEICLRILETCRGSDLEATDDPVGRAINHPVGHVTEALLTWWYRQKPEDNQGLPTILNRTFAGLCDANVPIFRHGRVVLSRHVIALFRVDPGWATMHLTPLFDWHGPEAEARAVWEGFLGSPRLYRPLLDVIKRPFLETALHYTDLGDHRSQYATVLTFAALDPGDTFTKAEMAGATRSLPAQGLQDAAVALVRALEGAGDQREDYWRSRVVPYIKSIWPTSRGHVTPSIAGSLARLCVAAGDALPDAVGMLRPWLISLEFPEYTIHRLHESGLCDRSPKASLDLLASIIGDQTQHPPSTLPQCLASIRSAEPSLVSDQRFKDLLLYLRRHGKEDPADPG